MRPTSDLHVFKLSFSEYNFDIFSFSHAHQFWWISKEGWGFVMRIFFKNVKRNPEKWKYPVNKPLEFFYYITTPFTRCVESQNNFFMISSHETWKFSRRHRRPTHKSHAIKVYFSLYFFIAHSQKGQINISHATRIHTCQT